jgi:hypothetical protein
MRKRTLLVVVPLVVVALLAGVGFAAPGGEHADDAELDKLHVVRPIAASPELQQVRALPDVMAAAAAYVHALREQEFRAWLDAVAAYLGEAAEANAPRRSVTRSRVYSNSYNGDFLACVKQRESGGDYTVYNSQGSGAAGAYQMMPGTWNSIAASSGRPDLVGLDPAAAPPADQDAMAAALYAQQGSAPWGGGC